MQKEKDKQNCIPKCPICGSSNINKITVGSRAIKTAVFGVVGAVDDAGSDFFGSESDTFSGKLQQARNSSINKMIDEAIKALNFLMPFI